MHDPPAEPARTPTLTVQHCAMHRRITTSAPSVHNSCKRRFDSPTPRGNTGRMPAPRLPTSQIAGVMHDLLAEPSRHTFLTGDFGPSLQH